MTLLAAVLGLARAADAIDTLPAQLVSVDTWEARTAAVDALLARTTNPPDVARVEAAREVVRLLIAREPEAPRIRIRALVAGAVDRRPGLRSEATKAAALGVDLPVIPSREAWYARVPHPFPPGAPGLHLAAPDLAEWGPSAPAVAVRLTEIAAAVDWPVADPTGLEVHGTLVGVHGARWDERAGYAADVRWTVARAGAPVFDVVTRGFQAGPLRQDAAEQLVGTAFSQLLAQDGLQTVLAGGEGVGVPDPEITSVEVHQVCVYRTVQPDTRPLTIDVGGVVYPIAVATYGCLDLPAGIVVASTAGRGEVVVGAVDLLLRVDDAEVPGQTTLTTADPAAFEKLKAKGKLTKTVYSGAPPL